MNVLNSQQTSGEEANSEIKSVVLCQKKTNTKNACRKNEENEENAVLAIHLKKYINRIISQYLRM